MEQPACPPEEAIRIPFLLSEQEAKLINYCRELGYGQFTVHTQKGQPVWLEEIKKTVKL